ncbi:hypothetical protein [Mycobacterium sp. OTB74]|jgi:hypothetical protein|uniref:hypothetical protein n=1 Tax=Mycobacterium sp. OTB74 TaxID=1853452 RepID=UPI0024756B9D|nr:hypothetical protein [Mycobacterium sp. OTB74]MDH6245719.1 hypothetical protein [Mycobacterium sp. OTB74]
MTNTPSRTELSMLAVFVAAGADPNRLARWFSDEIARDVPVETLAAAAEDLRCGTGAGWYAAAKRAAVA